MKKYSLFAILLCLAAAACGTGGQPASSSTDKISFGNYDVASTSEPAAVSGNRPVPQAGELNGGGSGGGGREEHPLIAQNISLEQAAATQQAPVNIDRRIIRNAELNLETESPENSQRTITEIAQSKGGFVVESQQSSSDVKINVRDVVSMTVRVPADKFTETLEEIRKTASRVVVETVKGEDVTEQFIDIEARLKAKKALEQQFMEIMKRANTVEDALSVQSQLADVRGEIEQIEGRKRFLENQSSLSTIKIRLQTPAVFSANSEGFFYRLTESFSTGLDIALNFILGLVTLVVGVLPFAVFIGLPGFLIARYFWRKQTRPRSVTEIAEEEIKSE